MSIPVNVVPALAFLGVGYLVATRRPRNPIGWLVLAVGLTSVPLLLQQYAALALLARSGSLPAGHAAAVAVNGAWAPAILALVLITFLFPSGRLPSRRWRPFVAIVSVSLGALFAVTHFAALDPPFDQLENPIRIRLGGILLPLVVVPIALGVATGLVAACASVVVRFRHSRGAEREQLKWFVYAATVIPLGIVVHVVVETFAPGAIDTDEALFSITVAVIPLAIGIAILRYRLYEIDRIISRTLVDASLTVVLGAAYAGLVISGQVLFASLAGGSNLAIAVSTLTVAALFLPLRSRGQGFVDRRFYRRRYDAQRTLEAFGARLREQVDLETLQAELRSVVQETMQPAIVSLWLSSKRLS